MMSNLNVCVCVSDGDAGISIRETVPPHLDADFGTGAKGLSTSILCCYVLRLLVLRMCPSACDVGARPADVSGPERHSLPNCS